MALAFSDEILTKREELDNYQSEQEALENDFNNNNQPDNVENKMKVKRLDDEITKLSEDNSNSLV